MTLSRTLLLPTGMAMTFGCHPARAADPAALDLAPDSLPADPDAPPEMPDAAPQDEPAR